MPRRGPPSGGIRSPAFEQETDETEEIEIMTYDFEQIEDLIGHGEITQLFSISAILMAKNYINAVIENE